jgi:cyanophycinase-like exopeptidase
VGAENPPFTEGQVATQIVARFNDPELFCDTGTTEPTSDPPAGFVPDQPDSYDATIDWGDGTTSVGVIAPDPDPTVLNGYLVYGTHTYADEGTPSITVSVTEIADPVESGESTATVNVADAPISVTITPPSGLVEPASFDGAIATITDGDPNDIGVVYNWTIDWGDGSPSDSGSTSDTTIYAHHDFLDETSNNVVVTVTDDGGATATAETPPFVADAPLLDVTPTLSLQTYANPSEGTSATVSATLTDALPNLAAADLQAVFTFGDGTMADASITDQGSGVFLVESSHTWDEAGAYLVHVTVTGPGGWQAEAASTELVTDPPLALTGVSLDATQGIPLLDGPLATSSDSGTPGTDYAATIAWGDGTSSPGIVVGDAVHGSHTYALPGPFTAHVVVTDGDGLASGDATSAVTVAPADPPGTLQAQAVSLAASAGTPLVLVTAGSFTDLAPPADPTYQALINWGDGTLTDATLDGVNIEGDHTYTVPGTYLLTVIVGDGIDRVAFGYATATVAGSHPGVAGTTLTVGAGVGQYMTVATITDPTPGTYTATILWGDSTTTPGIVTGGDGSFAVSGDHSYAEVGSYTALVIVRKDGLLPVVVTVPVTVDPAEEGYPASLSLMTFADTNPIGTVDDFTATVNWGDGTTSAGGIVALGIYPTPPMPLFRVDASHTWTEDGTYSVSVTVLDDGGSTVGHGEAIVVADARLAWDGPSISWEPDLQAPEMTTPDDQHNAEGDVVSLPIDASDPNGLPLTFDALGLPAGLSIDHTTGVISGTIDYQAGETLNGAYQVTVLVDDGQGGSSVTFPWRVDETIRPSVLANPGDQTNDRADSVSLPISASQPDGYALEYSAVGLPSGLGIDEDTGLISGTFAPTAADDSPYTVTVTATAGDQSASQTFTWVVLLNNHAPVLANLGDQENAIGDAVGLVPSAHDPDGDQVTYGAAGLPPGLSIDPSSGLIRGTLPVAAADSSPYTATVTATDTYRGATSQTLTWTVGPVGLATPDDQRSVNGDTVSLALQGLSAGGTLTYSASGLPPGLAIDPSSGIISGTLDAAAADSSPYLVTVSASDGTAGLSRTFTWNVDFLGVNDPGPQSATEGDSPTLQLLAYHSSGVPVTFSAVGLPPGLTLDPDTGVISGTLAAGSSADSAYGVTASVSDGTHTANQTFAWAVARGHDHPPTLTNPGAQVCTAGDNVSLDLVAADPDNDPLTFTATGLPDGLSIDPDTGTITGTPDALALLWSPYTVTVTADDGYGGTASQTFTWTVADAPLAVQALPVDATEGQDTGTLTVATFTDVDLAWDAGDFSATINWGDGTTTGGQITGAAGDFTVLGDHVYAEANTYPLLVTVTDTSGGSADAESTASVARAPLTLQGGLNEGERIGDAPSLQLALLTEDANEAPTNYAVQIDWGDSSAPTSGVVGPAADGRFVVSGTHAYAAAGSYPVTISVTDQEGDTATTLSTVTAGNVYAGSDMTLTVASFMDDNPAAPLDDYTATIAWGDGSTSPGMLSEGGGEFLVSGDHCYVAAQVYHVQVTITDEGGSSLRIAQVIRVVRPPLEGGAGNVQAGDDGSTGTVEVVAFAAPNQTDPVGEFTATIDWGDGTGGAGTVERVGDFYHVLGSHTFAAAGGYPVEVQVYQQGGGPGPVLALPAVAMAPGPMQDAVALEDDYYGLSDGYKTLAISSPTLLKNDQGLPNKGVRVEVVRKETLKGGEVVIDDPGEGTFTFTKGQGWNGTDEFQYTVLVDGKRYGPARVRIGTAYPGFTYYIDPEGNPNNVNINAKPEQLLIGGGERDPILDDAWTRFIQDAGGGDILVLRASDELGDQTAVWLRNLAKRKGLKLDSAETLVFDANHARQAVAAAKTDPFVAQKLKDADGIFLGGGDQYNYFKLWLRSPIQAKVQAGDVVVGGSSAGMHILGGIVYLPLLKPKLEPDQVASVKGISSDQALANAKDPNTELETGFIQGGPLEKVITDTHFGGRDRMGRLLVLLARASTAGLGGSALHGLAADLTTGIFVAADGTGTVYGEGAVYFLTPPEAKPHYVLVQLNPNDPTSKVNQLIWKKVKVVKMTAGEVFDLTTWQPVKGGKKYSISVNKTALSNEDDPTRDVYNNPRP